MRELAMKDRRSIERWEGPQDIANAGMLVQLKREGQANLQYDGNCARFRINPDPISSEYVASRISEIDPHSAVEQRIKHWQPTLGKAVTGKFRVCFSHEQTTLTYNLMLWNAPFGKNKIVPAMSIGVTRSAASSFEYAVVIAQNVMVDPQTSSFGGGILLMTKLKEAARWLRMTEWHTVSVLFAEDRARVDVQQGIKQEIVAEKRLIKPVEALGFVFSVDNEIFPGRYTSVASQEPEGFDMAYFEVGYSQ